jgi:hypothetical protein
MYNVIYMLWKFTRFEKKELASDDENRRELNKIDWIKDSTTRTRLLICILRKYSFRQMMCIEVSVWKVRTSWEFCLFIEKPRQRDKNQEDMKLEKDMTRSYTMI